MIRDTLLVIDDSELDLAILNEIFKHHFKLHLPAVLIERVITDALQGLHQRDGLLGIAVHQCHQIEVPGFECRLEPERERHRPCGQLPGYRFQLGRSCRRSDLRIPLRRTSSLYCSVDPSVL